jgi:predicted RNase H-like nuclease (RuvC/YqgF family)
MGIADNKLKKIISQYRHESETWKRYLQFIQQENNFLKTRLSQVLQNDTDIEFLERAEIFQNKFLSEDETVHLLRQDVHEMENMLTVNYSETKTMPAELVKKFKKLSRDMETVERQFHKLKTDFNAFVCDAV